jgi:hypothetical protein
VQMKSHQQLQTSTDLYILGLSCRNTGMAND